MINQPIPGNNHITRHVGPGQVFPDGRISGQAFRRRVGEEYMSVNWIEYFGSIGHSDAVQTICKLLRKKRGIKLNSKLVVISVGKMTEYVKKEANIALYVKHTPDVIDPSHSGVFNMPIDDTAVGNHIAKIIDKDAVYPASGKQG